MRLDEHSTELIQVCKAKLEMQDSYAYLPDIVEILLEINACIEKGDCADEYQRKLLRGFGRLVTESYEFSESTLGKRLLQFATDYRQQVLENG